MLLEHLLDIVSEWRLVFAQDRTFRRAARQCVAGLCAVGRRTVSRSLSCFGLDQCDWTAEYRVHSRSNWKPSELFEPILQRAHPMCGHKYLPVAYDAGHLRKTGRKIPGTSYWKDPLSPAFRVNFMWGCRYLQASLLVPHYHTSDQPARGLPIQFTEVAAVKKPGKKSTPEEVAAYKEAVKVKNLSTAFVAELKALRRMADDTGAAGKVIIAAVDGSFCNRECMTADVERTVLIGRTRKDAKLCFAAPAGTNRRYDAHKFTPEDVRQDESIPWQVVRIYHGGEWRDVRYKTLESVLWQGGTQRKPLRLIVVAPTAYLPSRNAKRKYHEAGYLLCTDLSIDLATLIQTYFDRWQIEVNHRDQKETLGVGQAQVWSKKSVPRQPAFMVASYSALLFAGILAFGPERTQAYVPLPKWRRKAKRPSAQDLVTVLRQEIAANPPCMEHLRARTDLSNMIAAAAA
jgi:hypothetical protein